MQIPPEFSMYIEQMGKTYRVVAITTSVDEANAFIEAHGHTGVMVGDSILIAENKPTKRQRRDEEEEEEDTVSLPFCACGRRISDCDGSRAKCRGNR